MGQTNSSKNIDEELALQNNDKKLAKIQEYLDQGKNVPLNIAVTGQSGSGKSSFINAIRGIEKNDEGAAPVGVKETTMEATSYCHPTLPSVKLWDLAARHLKTIKFEKYDFFIIISAGCFTENDVNLSKEIQKMKKKFYFVRSKIDQDIGDAKEDQREFNEEETLTTIRDDCIKGLQRAGFESPQVFLVSNRKFHLYDFHQLQETLERELPDHKKEAFLLSMPNISLQMINEKKKGFFRKKIKYFAVLSAAVAAVAFPGFSVAVDLLFLVGVITWFVFGFGLDIKSLKRIANYSGVPYKELRAVIISPLAAALITTVVLMGFLFQSGKIATLLAVEEDSRLISVLRIPVAMSLSFAFTYGSLIIILNMLAVDAEKVFQKVIV